MVTEENEGLPYPNLPYPLPGKLPPAMGRPLLELTESSGLSPQLWANPTPLQGVSPLQNEGSGLGVRLFSGAAGSPRRLHWAASDLGIIPTEVTMVLSVIVLQLRILCIIFCLGSFIIYLFREGGREGQGEKRKNLKQRLPTWGSSH